MNTNEREFVSIRAYSWLFALYLLGFGQAWGQTNAVRIVPANKADAWIELPTGAVLLDQDDTGKRWKLSGEIRVSLTVAKKDFEVCLNRQGWTRKHAIPTGAQGHRSELSTWIKGEHSILLLLSEDLPGACSFYVGKGD